MKRVLKWAMLALVLAALGIQFVGPARTNPGTDPSRSLAAVRALDPRVHAVLERACRDCHSNDTRWPWYSNVAPISWYVIEHVNHGRRHFNYSDWAAYDADEAQRLIKNSCAFARKGTMPLPSYLRMHRDARLTDADFAALCAWASVSD